MRRIFLLASMAIGCGIAACSDGGGDGGGGPGGSSGDGGGGTGGGTGGSAPAACFDYTGWDGSTPAVSLRADVMPILQGSCTFGSSCHGVESGPAGKVYLGPSIAMQPSDEQLQEVLAQTVNAEAAVEAGMPRITPENPARSFLMHKMDGTLNCGDLACAATNSCKDAMPLRQPAIPTEKRDTVRRWIAQGALDN
ncbi:hypothetical protein [Chondromyces crocatus]|uniref:Lipoprotein n=1 Tax=Chondromyces crocatus TaxID=52 RepID=A0A0K1EPQ1_CHOCO|nr:hypothetical protein [Chondromyces crocatus]AKT42622.1 uncharacterized protein CMC5_068490 [Chondromyces crocatus]